MSKSYIVEKSWTTQSGLQAVITKTGHRCGYVGIPKGHVTYEKTYLEQLDAISTEQANSSEVGNKSPMLIFMASVGADNEGSVRRSLDVIIDVHGGITYNSKSSGGDYPIPSNNLWWFGFDCSHYRDNNEIGGQTLEYCIHQCESMAEQLAELNNKSADKKINRKLNLMTP